MNSQPRPQQYFPADSIEWEELPSLAKRLGRRGANEASFVRPTAAGSPWDNTMPACFDTAPASQPFSESLAGLATREVLAPEIFLHFFGPDTLDR